MPLVECAYAELSRESIVPIGGDLAPPTPLFEALQTYTGDAPLGLGYDAVRSVVGATAPDLTALDPRGLIAEAYRIDGIAPEAWSTAAT